MITKDTTPGRKDDDTKTRFDLLPFRALSAVARVLTLGAAKYGDDNWHRVERLEDRYFSAAMRHMTARKLGEKNDPDDGLPHVAHAVCCLLFMLSKEVGFDAGFTVPTTAGPNPVDSSGSKKSTRTSGKK